ncbi:hypothetical protein A3Q56_04894, partial [Intoshia linei]
MNLRKINKNLEVLNKDKKMHVIKKNFKEAANTCNVIGSLLSKLNRHEEALEEHTEELMLCDKLDESYQLERAIACRRIGETLINLDRPYDAVPHLKKYYSISIKAKNQLEQQRALVCLGNVYWDMYITNREISLYLRDKVPLENFLNLSEKYHQKSFKLCQILRQNDEINQIEFNQMMSRFYQNLGLIHNERSDTEKAIKCFDDAYNMAKSWNLREDAFRVLTLQINLLINQEKYDEALSKTNESIKIVQKYPENSSKRITLDITRASILLYKNKFNIARKILKKLYYRYNKIDNVQEVFDVLRKVSKICKEYKFIDVDFKKQLNYNESNILYKKYEKIADELESLGLYKIAVFYYSKMMDIAEKGNLKNYQISISTESVAFTYESIKNYAAALKFYQKMLNMEISNDKKYYTYLNCIECSLLDKKTDIAIQLMKSCFEWASKTDTKYLHLLNQKFLKLMNNSNYFNGENLKVINNIVQQYCLDSVPECIKEISDNEKCSNSNESEDSFKLSSLDEDSCSNSSNEEIRSANFNCSKNLRRHAKNSIGSKFNVKRNEKGETSLHVATIKNNFNRVKSLVESGHPVNVKDHNGWTPLHEAANFDYVEIAKYLIEKGADVDIMGGNGCITPLHDACAAGSIKTVNLLIMKGASLKILSEGGTPYNQLVDFRKRSNDLSKNEIDEIRHTENYMAWIVAGNDRYGARKSNNYNVEGCVRDTSTISKVCSRQSENDKLILKNLDKGNDYKFGKKDYINTIESLRNQKKPINIKQTVKLRHSSHLLPNEVVDEWLVSDNCGDVLNAGMCNYPKKAKTISGVDSSSNSCDSISFDSPEKKQAKVLYANEIINKNENTFDQMTGKTPNKKAQSRITPIQPILPTRPCLSNNENAKWNQNLPIYPTNYFSHSKEGIKPLKSNMKIKVRVQDDTILIPINEFDNKKVDWLINQVISRYKMVVNDLVYPEKIHLMTSDFAILIPNDLLVDVIQDNDILICKILTWSKDEKLTWTTNFDISSSFISQDFNLDVKESYTDVPCKTIESFSNDANLSLNYQNYCKSLKLPTYKNVITILEQDNVDGCFDFNELHLPPSQLDCILSSFNSSIFIKSLSFNGNLFNFDSMKGIASHLQTEKFNNLVSLDLSHNKFNAESMNHFSDILVKSQKIFK